MDAEEEQPTRPTPLPDRHLASGQRSALEDPPGSSGPPEAREEERWPTMPLDLSSRPLPDVVFGTAQPPPPPPPPVPSGLPAASPAGPVTDMRHGRRMALLVAVALVGALAVGVVAVALWPSRPESRVRQSAPAAEVRTSAAPPSSASQDGAPADVESRESPASAPAEPPAQATGVPGTGMSEPDVPVPQGSPDPGTPSPSPSEPPVSGTTGAGVRVTYQTVEVSPGYFEGELTLTNESGADLPSWTVSFTYPGALIRNLWGGILGTRDGTVTITGDERTAPVAAGSSVTVRFGGSGPPSRPRSCLLNGLPCGF